MVKVPERRLSYGEILDLQRKESRYYSKFGTNSFKETDDVPITKNSPTGFIRKRKRHYKVKLKDKTLFQQAHSNREQFQATMREDQ